MKPRKFVAAVMFAIALPCSADDLLAKAPVFELLLDISGGSPATNPAFMAAAWPGIEEKIRAMPMGATVIITTVGNSESMPMMWRTRVQAKTTKDGAPIAAVVRGARTLFLSFPERIKGKEDKKSHLITGLFEASRQLNPNTTDNVIVMVSDLIENSPLANCTPPRPCKLPAPKFKLDTAHVSIIGSAARLPPKQAMTILKAWEAFFAKAGVDLRLYKTMGE
jgi:hypothetical protein